MKAIILAAGYATRLYPLTKDKAKALLPIGEKTILDYIMEKLEALPEWILPPWFMKRPF